MNLLLFPLIYLALNFSLSYIPFLTGQYSYCSAGFSGILFCQLVLNSY